MTYQAAKDAFLLDRKISGVSEKTVAFYVYTLKRFQSYLSDPDHALEATGSVLRDYFSFLRSQSPELSNSTIHAHMRGLRAFYRFCVEHGYIDTVPEVPRVRTPKESPRPLSVDEVARILDHLAHCKDFDAKRNGHMVRFILDTGMRLGECMAIDLGDIRWDTRCVFITRKGAREQWLPFGRRVLASLRDYMAIRARYARDHEQALWITRSGRRMRPRAFQTVLRRVSDRLDIHVYPHRLRHTFAVNWILAGGDPFTLQTLLGHESQHMVARYVKIAGTDVRAQHEKFSPGDRI